VGGPALLHPRLGGVPPPRGGHEHAGRGRHGRGVPVLGGGDGVPGFFLEPRRAPDVYYEAVLFIIALILLGNMLRGAGEAADIRGAARAGDLQPKTARVLRGGRKSTSRSRRWCTATSCSCVPASASRWTARSSPARAPSTSRCSRARALPVSEGVGDTVIGGTINRTGRVPLPRHDARRGQRARADRAADARRAGLARADPEAGRPHHAASSCRS
jgi:hypothetical protein